MSIPHLYGKVANAAALTMFVLVGVTGVRAESELEKALRQLSGDAAKGYIQPIGDLFGANMNAGYYHSAAIPKFGLTFR
ncbi:MAG: hypothetical protein HY708_03725, partial [Ignavibacteriae bacterium]|nr:hypothetical protein [Ignavibacteriota bacterium]